jgi:hypothetical protein
VPGKALIGDGVLAQKSQKVGRLSDGAKAASA